MVSSSCRVNHERIISYNSCMAPTSSRQGGSRFNTRLRRMYRSLAFPRDSSCQRTSAMRISSSVLTEYDQLLCMRDHAPRGIARVGPALRCRVRIKARTDGQNNIGWLVCHDLAVTPPTSQTGNTI